MSSFHPTAGRKGGAEFTTKEQEGIIRDVGSAPKAAAQLDLDS
jgi:hypothetical protein